MCDANPDNDCVQDECGAWGGSGYTDECGTCDDNPDNDCEIDCAGTQDGSAVIDACGNCVDGTTGEEACVEECVVVGVPYLLGPLEEDKVRGTHDQNSPREPKYLFDTNTSYVFSTPGSSMWQGANSDGNDEIYIDLDSPMTITEITLYPEPDWVHYERMPSSITMSVSDDTNTDNWTQVFYGTLPTPDEGLESTSTPTFEIANGYGQYFKFELGTSICPEEGMNGCQASHPCLLYTSPSPRDS